MDEFARDEVKKQDSWLGDTRHFLQIISEQNECGPQPPGTIPVTLDISGMYNNVPWTDGMTALEEAMDRRENQAIPTLGVQRDNLKPDLVST